MTQANNLKPLITDDWIPVVKKGKDGGCIENCTTIFASSNHSDAAVFGERDRRYDVIATNATMMPAGLSARMYSLIQNRPAALLWLVLAYGKEAASFNPNAAPIQSGAKQTMMEAARSVWAEEIRDAYELKVWPFEGDALAVSDARQMLATDTDRMPSNSSIRAELLGLAEGAYSTQAQQRRGVLVQQKRVIVLRNISVWKEAGPSALYEHYANSIKRGPAR